MKTKENKSTHELSELTALVVVAFILVWGWVAIPLALLNSAKNIFLWPLWGVQYFILATVLTTIASFIIYRIQGQERQQLEIQEAKEKEFEKEQNTKGLYKFKNQKSKIEWITKEDLEERKSYEIGLKNNFADYSPFEFEELIARLFKRMGYKTIVTSKTGDYGIDVIAEKETERIAIQCKKYGEGNNVSNRDVQRLLGAMKLRNIKANKAILVTTSDFTVQAQTQAEENPIELWDNAFLRKMIRRYFIDKELQNLGSKQESP